MYEDKRVVSIHYEAEAVLLIIGEATPEQIVENGQNNEVADI